MLPAHLINDIAITYLSSWDRRRLCDTSRVLRNALIRVVSIEGAHRHIPLVVTVSGVHRMLAEIARLPYAMQEGFVIELAKGNGNLPIARRYAGVEAILEFVKDWQPEPRAKIIAALATTLRLQMKILSERRSTDPGFKVEFRVWEEARELPDYVRGIAQGALLRHNAIGLHTPIRLPEWIQQAHRLPPSGRAELLEGLARVWDDITDGMNGTGKTNASWEVLIRETLALPPHLRIEPLYAVSNIASTDSTAAPERWTRLMELAATQPAIERAVIYRSLANALSQFHQKDRIPYFDALWRCCDELSWADQVQTLETLAKACLELPVPAYGADRIVEASVSELPPIERLRPLKVLLAPPRLEDVRIRKGMRTLILQKTLDFPQDERGQLLGYCGAGMELSADMEPLVAEARTLPGAVRHWVLEGLTQNWARVKRVGGATWIDNTIMPLLTDIPAASRTQVLLNLAVITFGGGGAFPLSAKEPILTSTTWATVNRYISDLPADELVKLLREFIKLADDPALPSWEWALNVTNELPAGRRALLLKELASVRYMPPHGRSAPLHKLLSAISALPPFYRACPLQVVDTANGKVDGFGDFVGYWKALFRIAAAKRTLPREDRF